MSQTSLYFPCFQELKTVFENCIQTCPNIMVFASFFFGFFFFAQLLYACCSLRKREVECCMNQYGVYEEQTYSKFRKQIENGWLVFGKTTK